MKTSVYSGGTVIGEILRKKREETDQDLRQIANTLKIRYDYLKAIEDEDLKKLPAEVYLKGYLLEYAKILKLDPEMVMDTYMKQTSASQHSKEKLYEKESIQQKRINLKYVLILLAVILLIVVLVKIISSPSSKKSELFPSPVVNKNEAIEDRQDTEPTPSPSSEKAEKVKENASRETLLSAEASQHVLEISAIDTTWISVTIDNANTREILMNPGDSVTLHAKNGFFLKIGNAGGVRLLFNGEKISQLGQKGQVVRLELPLEKT